MQDNWIARLPNTFHLYQRGRFVSKPIEDTYPFLEREELLRQMIFKTIDE